MSATFYEPWFGYHPFKSGSLFEGNIAPVAACHVRVRWL